MTLTVTTLLYVMLWQIEGPFWAWALVSLLLGLGFTFFSGAVEAWLVDALQATGYEGDLETVFGRGQVVTGIAMLTGSVAGGYIAQATSLGVPFVLRGVVLAIMFVVAFAVMKDVGFTPVKGKGIATEMRSIAKASVDYGLRVPAVRWLMISSIPLGAVGIYAFYALQPYLLELAGDPEAYGIAGLTAAIVAGAQIVGGIAAPPAARPVPPPHLRPDRRHRRQLRRPAGDGADRELLGGGRPGLRLGPAVRGDASRSARPTSTA